MRDRVVIVGATSSVAENCAREWIAKGKADFVLLGRDENKLESLAQDLRARMRDGVVDVIVCDFLDINAIESISSSLIFENCFFTILISHGILVDQNACIKDLSKTNETLLVNGVSVCNFAQAFCRHLSERNAPGRLAVIGSVAAERARKSNYCYGASKSLINYFVSGLRQRYAGCQELKIFLIKLGPTLTPMTADLKNYRGRLADVKLVAKRIVGEIESGRRLDFYVPTIWRWIMVIVRLTPNFIFRRLEI
jgi:decaprenylphospho-beta-D-erythro-pentofuranosid-2-ulose 2-reductase